MLSTDFCSGLHLPLSLPWQTTGGTINSLNWNFGSFSYTRCFSKQLCFSLLYYLPYVLLGSVFRTIYVIHPTKIRHTWNLNCNRDIELFGNHGGLYHFKISSSSLSLCNSRTDNFFYHVRVGGFSANNEVWGCTVNDYTGQCTSWILLLEQISSC